MFQFQKAIRFLNPETFQPTNRVVLDISDEFIQDFICVEQHQHIVIHALKEQIETMRDMQKFNGPNRIVITPYKNMFEPDMDGTIVTWVPSDVIDLHIVSFPCFIDKQRKSREAKSFKTDLSITEDYYMKLVDSPELRIELYKILESTMIENGIEYFYYFQINRKINPDTFKSEFTILYRGA